MFSGMMKTVKKSSVLAVTIKYLSALRDKTGRRQEEISLPGGSRLGDAAHYVYAKYGIQVPDPQIMFILNGKGWNQHPEGLETPLKNGDTILILPPVSGG
jgi:MoaD family protein